MSEIIWDKPGCTREKRVKRIIRIYIKYEGITFICFTDYNLYCS